MTTEASFDSSARGLRELGASAEERELVEWLSRHGQEEGELLERYERLLARTTSPSTRYLMNLILEDERRHHRLLAEIAEAIAWGILPRPGSAVPRPDGGDADEEVVAETRALLASEKRDRRELKKLRRRLSAYHGTMWPLLIDLMSSDTDKHTRILDFLLHRRPR